VDKLAEWIVSERFAAGGTLPVEARLCEELGVSRTTLREAIKTLAAKGMVEVSPKLGSRVLDESAWQIFDPQVLRWRLQFNSAHRVAEDLVELRMMLEPAAAALAAERADWTQRREIRDAYQRMERSVGKRQAFQHADIRFHKLILLACRNLFLVRLAPLMETLISTTLDLYAEAGWNAKHIERAGIPLHGDMMQAIVDGRPDDAREASAQIIARARQDMMPKPPAARA
jgi:GntR family transcriptional regulator, galactonate operon transcriptional repressor